MYILAACDIAQVPTAAEIEYVIYRPLPLLGQTASCDAVHNRMDASKANWPQFYSPCLLPKPHRDNHHAATQPAATTHFMAASALAAAGSSTTSTPSPPLIIQRHAAAAAAPSAAPAHAARVSAAPKTSAGRSSRRSSCPGQPSAPVDRSSFPPASGQTRPAP